jgi:polysaccharide biosynthesis protein PelF
MDDEDRALGRAGLIVKLANPAAFAQAVLALLGDDARWNAAQAAGLARVARYYTREQMVERYRALYDKLLASPGRSKGGAARCPVDHHATQETD